MKVGQVVTPQQDFNENLEVFENQVYELGQNYPKVNTALS